MSLDSPGLGQFSEFTKLQRYGISETRDTNSRNCQKQFRKIVKIRETATPEFAKLADTLNSLKQPNGIRELPNTEYAKLRDTEYAKLPRTNTRN
ncbi:hypothetical protein JTE90_001521 [Oedothorax gibbosus]|uniref:Uncharacterized protein n=1 Tax=Oedothorax gibbosus TaxID=931172 RepID=A0AAV6UHU2_9ARAC|nr:hypothetical protein JTE90_001521 [Oedothorax gibbosus]